MKDFLINFAKSKVATIAQKTGKSEAEILSAIEKGKDGGYDMARQVGLTKDVAKQIYDKYGYLADRIPLVGRALFNSEFAKILPNLDDEPQVSKRPQQAVARPAKKFDKSKYF
jgi:hypothetical protein